MPPFNHQATKDKRSPMSQEYRDIFTVSRLTAEVRAVLEGSFPLVWVEGEVSNLAAPGSGHLYFTLKDDAAQVRCALFKNRRTQLRKLPENGAQVVLRARISLYESRGDFQLIIEHLEPAGAGRLRLAFEQLKRRLQTEGLFDAVRKQAIPRFPRRIGVITSPTSAAIRDVLQILRRRVPHIPVRIYPAQVQGADAPAELIAALELARRDAACDILILTRGGGSLEDLAAFNDESLARAIAALDLPLISAVGHEIDFTITDFVADQRAPTPSAAAELVAAASTELVERLSGLRLRFVRCMAHRLSGDQARSTALIKRLALLHPERRLQQRFQSIDDCEMRLRRALAQSLSAGWQRVHVLGRRLAVQTPRRSLERYQRAHRTATSRLRTALDRRLQRGGDRLVNASARLQSVSPLGTLERGYAIATRKRDGAILRTFAQVAPGDAIKVRLVQGSLDCRVKQALPPADALDDVG
jgi:exodeoxyribonuclease VII large subunit